MTQPDLYLIAHKVHGSPAFDIAQRIACPECHAIGCEECDQLGYWWIVGTSGHRAYPYHTALLVDIAFVLDGMPPDLPDHYPHHSHAEAPQPSLAERLGLNKQRPVQPIVRRL